MKESERKAALQEVELLKKLTFPHACAAVVQYFDSFVDEGSLWIAMEYCSAGDLERHIKAAAAKSKPFTEAQIQDWLGQLVLGVHHIHEKRALHRMSGEYFDLFCKSWRSQAT